MAYSQQTPFGAHPRPHLQNPQPSFASSHQGYATEYGYDGGYDDGSQDPAYHGRPIHAVPLLSQAAVGQGGGYGEDRDDWKGRGNARYINGEVYGGREPPDNRRGPAQHSQPNRRGGERPDYIEPGSRGPPPQPSSQFSMRNTQQPQDQSYRQGQQPYPKADEQQCTPEHDLHNSALGRADTGYRQGDQYYGQQQVWEPANQYGDTLGRSANGYDPNIRPSRQDPTRTGAAPPLTSTYSDASVPRSAKSQSQDSTVKSETSSQSKPKRIVETPISPDQLAWDNPFPTFPLAKKNVSHTNPRSIDGSTGGQSSKGESLPDTSHEDRPQTASSSYTIAEHMTSVQYTSHPTHQDRGYADHKPSPHGAAEHRRDAAPRSHEPRRTGRREQQLQPPTVNGRHSEDNRARPMLPVSPDADLNHERSRTMPTTISEAALKNGQQPGYADQSIWQEPGLVAGYFGPEDKEFLPPSPGEPPSQQHFGQPMAELEHREPYVRAAPLGRDLDTHQPYEKGTDQRSYQAYTSNKPQEHLPANEDMPNFGTAPDSSSIRRRGLTIDDHLHPHQRPQESRPIMSTHNTDDRRRDYRRDPNANDQYLPRSRSQPNFRDRRSPRPQYDVGFDFGVPGPNERPPVIVHAQGDDYGTGPHSAVDYSSQRPPWGGRPPREPDYAMPMSAGYPPKGYPPNDRNRAYAPPPRGGPPINGYPDHAPPDRYRSPPAQSSRPPGPKRPPGGGPSPIDRNGPHRPSPPAHQNSAPPDQYRSQPPQQRRSPQGQRGPPGGRPSPNSRMGPTKPPQSEPTPNPDTLPSHPAPFRPGLNGNTPAGQASKPAPVRQYNAAPSPGSGKPESKKRESIPITHQELERLKHEAVKKPDSQSIQLNLAKGLVEAAAVLVDERADPRTKSKAREKNTTDAYRIIKKLSSNGYPDANFYLADAYSRGSLGLDPDVREAFKLYQAAAKTNHPQAAYRVAVCCEIGQEEGGGTARDPVKAMQWYKRAATLGDTPAMYKMGIISLKGLLGQPKNVKEALIWLNKAAERADQENPHALHELVSLSSLFELSNSHHSIGFTS